MKKRTIITLLLTINQCIRTDMDTPTAKLTIPTNDTEVQQAFQENKERYTTLTALAENVQDAKDPIAYQQALEKLQKQQQIFAEKSAENLERKEKQIQDAITTQPVQNIAEPKKQTIRCTNGKEFQIYLNGTDKKPIIISGRLAGCDFSQKTIENVIFKDIKLVGAKFRLTKLKNVTFKGNTDLTGAFFDGATLDNVSFLGSDATGSLRLYFATFKLATLQNVLFRDSVLQTANFAGSQFGPRNLTQADNNVSVTFESSFVEQADFTKAKFNGVSFDSDCSLAQSSFVATKGSSLTFGPSEILLNNMGEWLKNPAQQFDYDTGYIESNKEQFELEGAGEYQPNLHMTNFNNAAITKLRLIGDAIYPLNLIGTSSAGAKIADFKLVNAYYDIPAKDYWCGCLSGKNMSDFMQIIKNHGCNDSPCTKDYN